MGLADQMYNPDFLADIKSKLKSLASDIEPLAEANKVYMVMYNDATFNDVNNRDHQEVIAGEFDAIYFKEDKSGKHIFQIVLRDMEEQRKLVISGSASAFVVLDFLNRLCMMNPVYARIELFFERNGQYVNGCVREVETGSELMPLMYYKSIPKDKDERLQLYLKHVSDLMQRKEAFAQSKK
jgi:hypothetical protein